MKSRDLVFWFLCLYFSMTFVMILLSQIGMFHYDVSVQFGQHVPVEWIGETGVAMSLGFNVADIVQQLFCVLAVMGLFRRKMYGWIAALCEMAISLYWPLAMGATYFFARETQDFSVPSQIVTSQFVLFGFYVAVSLICMIYLVQNRYRLVDDL